MDLKNLFETQKILRDRINYQGEDRFEKLVLSLLVELGECANEWRGFKFWSKDQNPRTKEPATAWGEPYKNPLLEEYVDGFHFVMELGIENNHMPTEVNMMPEANVTDSFLTVMEFAVKYEMHTTVFNYSMLFAKFLELGKLLGFTEDEIESAYYAKNKLNHQRQESGY